MKQTILSFAEGLGLDESKAGLICPSCKGGVHRDKSFVVTRVAHGVLWYCYRAKCGEKGLLLSVDRALMRSKTKSNKVFVPRVYEGRTESLSEDKEYINGEYHISTSELVCMGARYNPERHAIVYPILDYRGYTIGVEDRVYDGSRSLKSIHYWEVDAPKVHFCRIMVRPQPYVVVVEDMLSGIKCNRHAPTVVALGTALNQKIEYIRRFTDSIVLYLDRDALGKAVGYKKRYSMFFKEFKVVYTKEDPKSVPDDELKRLLVF